MGELWLPVGMPPLYRGGPSLAFKAYDVKVDRRTGLLKTTHGVSVDADPEYVARFGSAYVIRGIPQALTVVQRGRRPTHYEIVPAMPMTPQQYQALLDEVKLEPFQQEP